MRTRNITFAGYDVVKYVYFIFMSGFSYSSCVHLYL